MWCFNDDDDDYCALVDDSNDVPAINIATLIYALTMCHGEEADGKAGQTDREEFTEYCIVVIPVYDNTIRITITVVKIIIK